MQDMAMLQFFDKRRIMDLQQLRMPLVIGRRHEQIQDWLEGSREACAF
jgi:hypothetical protein